jgi:SAM-dependent methyltransferase
MGLMSDFASIAEGAGSAPAGFGYEEISRAIIAHFDPRMSLQRPFRVLEAGGGSDNWLPLPPDSQITTIDISPEQLAQNTYAREKLLGDLQTFDYGPRRFDLIICWDVLEHLERPADAIARFAAILAPGGCLVIKGPLKRTVKGLMTCWTPHALHVAFYRYVLRSPTAGQAGHPPFQAFLAHGAAPEELGPLLEGHGVTVEAVRLFESAHVAAIARRSRLLFAGYRACERLLSLMTFGRYARGVTDFFLIARRAD